MFTKPSSHRQVDIAPRHCRTVRSCLSLTTSSNQKSTTAEAIHEPGRKAAGYRHIKCPRHFLNSFDGYICSTCVVDQEWRIVHLTQHTWIVVRFDRFRNRSGHFSSRAKLGYNVFQNQFSLCARYLNLKFPHIFMPSQNRLGKPSSEKEVVIISLSAE